MIRPAQIRRPRDPSIALINVVFLMLIFFLLAGTVAPPKDPDLRLVSTSALAGSEPPDALVLRANGDVYFRGAPADLGVYMQGREAGPVRIVPDRAVAGARLMEVSGALRRLGATSVILVTEQALE